MIKYKIVNNKKEIVDGLNLIEEVYKIQVSFEDSINGQKTFINDLNDGYLLSGLIEERIKMIGAFYDEKIVGVVIYEKNFIDYLFVNMNYQHQGIASKLLSMAILDIKEFGYDNVQLFASLFGLDFYLKKGFEVISEKKYHNEMVYVTVKKDIKAIK